MSFEIKPDKFYIQWHITNKCLWRCRHCYQDEFSSTQDLSWPELLKICANLLAGLRKNEQEACLNITGGEPLLKPELWPLLEHLSGQPEIAELGIITNGLLLNKEIIARLASFPKLRQLKVSLEGPSPEINDSLRGPGSFRKIKEKINLLQKNGNLQIFIMATVMHRNFRTLFSLSDLGQELRVEGLILERFIPWGQGKEIRAEALSKEEWREFIHHLCAFMDIGEETILWPFPAFQINFQDDELTLLGAPCALGVDGFCLMPNGEIYPCRRFPIPLGNLRYDSWVDIWENSPLLRELRRKENLKGKCQQCSFKNCRGCRSLALALTGDYLAEDPHCGLDF